MMREQRLFFDDHDLKRAAMPRMGNKPTPKASGGDEAATRLRSMLDGKGWDSTDLIRALEKDGMQYKAAHAAVTRILEGKGGNLQDKTRVKFQRALGIPDASIFSAGHAKTADDARVAVVTGLIEAPRSSNDEIISDIRVLLEDPVTAPYLKMATKILKHLS